MADLYLLSCLWVFLLLRPSPLPKDHGATLLSLAHVAAPLFRLFVRHEVRGLVAEAVEQKDVDASVALSALEVLGASGLDVPWSPPWDGPGFEVGKGAIGNHVVRGRHAALRVGRRTARG